MSLNRRRREKGKCQMNTEFFSLLPNMTKYEKQSHVPAATPSPTLMC